jgi:hypothetical protein
MKTRRHRINCRYLTFIAVLVISRTVLHATETADLRGYGKISADLAPHRGVFDCENAEKADILLDKLQADLFWDTSVPPKRTDIHVGTATVAAYSLEGHGSAVIARSGRRVVILGAPDEDQAAALAAKEPLLLGGDVTSQAAKPHPLSLDYFDNRAFKAYTSPMKSSRGFGVESHWPFMKSLGGAMAFFGPALAPPMAGTSAAPGAFSWVTADYEVREAERQGEMVVLGPEGGGVVPVWARNISPENMMEPSDTTALGDWGGAFMAGSGCESWSTPLEQRSLFGLGFFQRAIERYGSSPAVGGWMPFAGSPGVEYSLHHGRAMSSWDHSPTGQEGWRRWLREERRWSLADVGIRWYGDPKRFSSWAEVRVPDLNGFFGAFGPDSFQLTNGWRWQNAAAFAPNPIASEAQGWVPVAMPPSQQQAFLTGTGVNYFDVTLDPSDWRKEQKEGADVWLVFGMIGTGSNAVKLWWNDHALEVPKDLASRNGSFAIRVTGLVKPGPNHLQVALACASYQACNGKLAGPVFLTAHEPKRFPYLGRQANARYVDLIEWQAWAISDYHRQTFKLARKLDPDRPFVLSGWSAGLTDHGIRLATDFGMGVENTGREASYRPHLPGLGMAAGFYSTSEWSGTPLGDSLDRGFGWILFDGDSSHCLYHNIEDFQQRERDDGWFTKHRRQIQLFGKYLREQPKVALFQSVETANFAPEEARWDGGHAQMPAAHYDNVYVTEQGVKDGLADSYPVVIDTGSAFMEPDTAAAIRKYVERGGTFVAIHNTALHTAIEPDACALAGLSGFKVSTKGRGGKLRFDSDPPIFREWEGKEFDGWGVVMDSVSSGGDPAIPLAKWSDGTVAVGYRRVGQGRIITLGTTFWWDGKDAAGIWTKPGELNRQFLERLFTDCGVTRTANASVPEIWTRKMVTKNGLQNWLMALNGTPAAREADVWMATEGQPEEVINLETDTKVPFVLGDDGVSIKGVHFNAYEIKTFAARRSTLAGSLPVWWGEKTTYWKRTPAQIAAKDMILPEPNRDIGEAIIPLEKWRFQTDADNTITSQGAWTSLPFDDAAWKIKEDGPWNYFDPELSDYHGTGLYRIKFTVPRSWDGRRILLGLYDYDAPIVYDSGDFHINGTKVASYAARGWSQTLNYDVTSLAHPGENVLALKAVGGPKLGGLGGVVWIESWSPLIPSLDLNGVWQAVKGDWLTRVDAAVPGSVKAKYLVREMQIPVDWKGKGVFLEWSSRNQWVGSVVINGKPINYNAFAHPYGLFARVNVTPYLKPGERNVVEIWPFQTMTHHADAGKKEVDGLQLDSIRIGCK